MIVFSRYRYRLLLAELRCHHRGSRPLQQKIEACFGSCYHHWSAVSVRATHHVFTDMHEEITFFKTIKPLFTSLIEYYQLIYHAILFQPDLSTGHVKEFWEREAHRLPAFIDAHPHFVTYYTSGRTEHDAYFFSRVPPIPGVELPHSRVDHLVSRYLALQRYGRYLKCRKDRYPL